MKSPWPPRKTPRFSPLLLAARARSAPQTPPQGQWSVRVSCCAMPGPEKSGCWLFSAPTLSTARLLTTCRGVCKRLCCAMAGPDGASDARRPNGEPEPQQPPSLVNGLFRALDGAAGATPASKARAASPPPLLLLSSSLLLPSSPLAPPPPPFCSYSSSSSSSLLRLLPSSSRPSYSLHRLPCSLDVIILTGCVCGISLLSPLSSLLRSPLSSLSALLSPLSSLLRSPLSSLSSLRSPLASALLSPLSPLSSLLRSPLSPLSSLLSPLSSLLSHAGRERQGSVGSTHSAEASQ
eukprot:879359-Rhodomonas_salina.1